MSCLLTAARERIRTVLRVVGAQTGALCHSEGANRDSLGGFSGISKMGNHDRISKSVGIREVLGTHRPGRDSSPALPRRTSQKKSHDILRLISNFAHIVLCSALNLMRPLRQKTIV